MENVLHAPAQRRAGNRTATLAACVLAAFALLAVVAAGIALGAGIAISTLRFFFPGI